MAQTQRSAITATLNSQADQVVRLCQVAQVPPVFPGESWGRRELLLPLVGRSSYIRYGLAVQIPLSNHASHEGL